MSTFLKWLVFIALTSGYVFAVFFWDRDAEEHSQDISIQTTGEPTPEEAVEETYASPDENYEESDAYEEVEEPVMEIPEETQAAPVETGMYVIISGSYTSEIKAEKALEAYTSNYNVEGQIKFYDPYYKVVLGSANSLSSAKQLLQSITDQGITAFIQKDS